MLIILTVSSGNWMLPYCLHSYFMIIKGISKLMLPLVPGSPFFSTFTLNTTEKASFPQSLSIWPTFNIKLIWCSGHFVHVGYEWFQVNNYIQVSINVYHFVSIVRFFRIWPVFLCDALSLSFVLLLRETLAIMHGFLAITTWLRMLL